MQTLVTPNRLRSRSTTGMSVVTSAVLPGHSSQQIATAGLEGLKVKAGETLKLPAVRFPLADQELSGVVVDPRGKPVAHALVAPNYPKAEGVTFGPSPDNTLPFTDELGRFRLTSLPRGIPRISLTVVPTPTMTDSGVDDETRTTVDAELGRKDVRIVLPDRVEK